MTTTATVSPTVLTAEQKAEILSREINGMASKGWHLVSQTSSQASFEKGKNTSHGLHIFLSIITLGLWLIVWLLLAIFAGRKTCLINVDDYGNITRR